MPRKSTTEEEMSEPNELNYRLIRRWLLIVTGCSIAAAVMLLAWQQLERFLLRDSQFSFAAPADPSERGPNLHVEGVKNASPESLAAVFEPDYGRSIYSIPVARRRLDILASPWISEASVSRVWPNRITVQVSERQPVAFAAVKRRNGAGEESLLIDADGTLLRAERKANYNLPLLAGIDSSQNEEERKLRVHRMLKLIREAGPLAENISEVNAADPNNLRVVQNSGGRAVTLILGDRFYRRRLQKYAENQNEILRRYPGVVEVDLRTDGSILLKPGEGEPKGGE